MTGGPVSGLVLLVSCWMSVVNPVLVRAQTGEVAPLPSPWQYYFTRCDTWHGPYSDEPTAAMTAANAYYGNCGDATVAASSGWGTFDHPVPGPCGSSNDHPHPLWDYRMGLQTRNYQSLSIGYCRTPDFKGYRDGLTLRRTRGVECPAGYTSSGNPNGYNPPGNRCLPTGAPVPGKNLGAQRCPLSGPVNLATGNNFQAETDVHPQGADDLPFERYYNSDAHVARGMLGKHWRSTYDRTVVFSSNTRLSTAFLMRPDGKQFAFTLDPDSAMWRADADITARLTPLTNALGVITGWRFQESDNTIETYDADGQLLSLTADGGATRTLTYDGQGRLASVTAQSGRRLEFGYDSKGRLITLTQAQQRVYRYVYDGSGRLAQVIYPDDTPKDPSDNPARLYHYEDPSHPDALTGITDERGIRQVSYRYDAAGRVTMQQKAGNVDRLEIVYHDVNGTRTVTDALGRTTTYTTAVQLGVSRITGIEGPGSQADTRYRYDQANHLIGRTRNGITTRYGHYDSKGHYGCQVEGVTAADTTPGECAFDPTLSPAARRIDYSYDPRFYHKLTSITEPSVFPGRRKVTTYTYDAFGHKTSETIAGYDPNGHPISRTTTWQYGGDDSAACDIVPLHQLCRIDGPRTDVDDITVFDYYPDDPAQGPNRARLRRIIDANGSVVRQILGYTTTGKVARERRPNGLTLSYTYQPGSDRLESLTEADGTTQRVTHWSYLPSGEVTSVTVGAGTPEATSLQFDYDDARRLIRIRDGAGNTLDYTLDSVGNRSGETIHDPDGTLLKTVQRTFDGYDRLATLTRGENTEDYDYDARGRLVRHADGTGVVTTLSYDTLDRLTRLTRDAGGDDPATADNQAHYHYDPQDHPVLITAANQAQTARLYDDLGNLIEEDSADTGLTTYRYDPAGNRVQRVDANGTRLTYRYDAGNRLLEIRAPAMTDDLRVVYDLCPGGIGSVCRIEAGDPMNPVTVEDRYNAFGEVLSQQGLSYTYDAAGRIHTMTYPSGAVVTYHRDAAGRLDQIELQHQGQTLRLADQIRYAPFGPLTSLTYGNGLTLQQPLDTAYRPTGIHIPGVLEWRAMHYDGSGHLSAINDLLHASRHYRYDALDRLVEASGDFGTQTFGYDANGNRLQWIQDTMVMDYDYEVASNRLTQAANDPVVLDAVGNTLQHRGRQYHYNAHHRLVAADGNGHRLAGYRYNGLGQRIEKQLGAPSLDDAAQASEYQTHADRLNQQASQLQGQVDTLARQAVSLENQASQLNQQARQFNQQVASATAQAQRDRTRQQRSLHQATVIETRIQRYLARILIPTGEPLRQWIGNLVQRIRQWGERRAGHYRLLAAQQGRRAGRLQARAQALMQRAQTKQIQAESLRRQAQDVNAQAALLGSQIDDLQAQAAQSQAQADYYAQLAQNPRDPLPVKTFHYDLQGHLVAENDAEGTPIEEIVYLEDRPLAVLRQGNVYYLHTDHLNTPRAVTDAHGQVIWTWNSDPFGSTRPDEDPDGDGIPFVFNLRFPGQYYDQETGLYYNYFRTYDPGSGRYTTSDPIGLAGGLNTYTYVEGNPLSWSDPLGLRASYCQRPLGDYSGQNGGGPPVFNHQFICVTLADGTVRCDSTNNPDNDTNPLTPAPGVPSRPDRDNENIAQCENIDDDTNRCFEDCVLNQWTRPRPDYAIGPLGTDCQEYSRDIVDMCRARCP